MHFEVERKFPGDAKEAFDYLNDFRTWPEWYTGMIELIEPAKAAWAASGDRVKFAYRILGRRVEVECRLDELRPAEYVKLTATIPMVGDVKQEWIYDDSEEGFFTLKAVMETDEPTSFFGRAVDKMVIPRVLERDWRHTLDHLAEIFTFGIPG